MGVADNAAPKQNKDAASPRGRGEIILIVEDNARLRKLSIGRILDLGFKTLEADSSDQAFQMLKDGAEVDLVFSNFIILGNLNGYHLAAKIVAEFPPLKVLLTSGYTSDVVPESMVHGLPPNILHKPYRQSDLAQRLHALLAVGSDA